MNQVTDFFKKLFDTSDWPPRWHCGNWSDFHGWLYVISDLLIWVSYFAIPILLLQLILKRKDVPFLRIFWLFGAFILLCGLSHLIDAIIFWWPAYRLSALIRLVTGLVSVITVIALWKILPQAFSLRSPLQLQKEIEQRKKAQKEVQMLNLQLQSRISQLQQFAYITSHNLRTPVCSLTTLIDLYKEDISDDVKDDLFENIDTISKNMTQSLNELSEIIKITNNVSVERSTVLFEEILNKSKENLMVQILETKASIKADFSACPVINYPGVYLESIFLNLLSNAIRYRSANRAPEITFKSLIINNQVVIKIQDNGMGIDLKQYGNRIFGLYKTFHYHPEAKGVGLFITKTQIENLGGSIEVQSEPGSGTIFIIHFGKYSANTKQ